MTESDSVAAADQVLVNSQFTANTFKRTFTTITKTPTVLYPSVDASMYKFDQPSSSHLSQNQATYILSLNRFERKKNIALSILAMQIVVSKLTAAEKERFLLYIAGGYDTRVQENVDHLSELRDLAKSCGLTNHVRFFTAVSDQIRNDLLRNCVCLLYTPPNEHFGIVPLEAGLARKAVLACNSGGPLETVVDGETGYLRDNNAAAWAELMLDMFRNPEKAQQLGEAGYKRVKSEFSLDLYREQVITIMREMLVDAKLK